MIKKKNFFDKLSEKKLSEKLDKILKEARHMEIDSETIPDFIDNFFPEADDDMKWKIITIFLFKDVLYPDDDSLLEDINEIIEDDG